MKKIKLTKKNLILFALLAATAIAIVVLDQITKMMAVRAYEDGKLPVTVIKGVLSISYLGKLGRSLRRHGGSARIVFCTHGAGAACFLRFDFFQKKLGQCGMLCRCDDVCGHGRQRHRQSFQGKRFL